MALIPKGMLPQTKSGPNMKRARSDVNKRRKAVLKRQAVGHSTKRRFVKSWKKNVLHRTKPYGKSKAVAKRNTIARRLYKRRGYSS